MEITDLRGNTIGNLQNGGFIADGGSYLYIYLNSKLYRVDKESNEKKILCEGEAKYLNVVGDLIYYIDKQDGTLYKIHKNGVEEDVFDYYKRAEEISIVGNWIYCIDSWSEYIFRIGVHDFKQDDSFIIDTVPLSMAIEENNIYFSDDQRNYLETLPLSGRFRRGEGRGIGPNYSNGVFFINIEDEWIYYLEEYKDYRAYDLFEDRKYYIYKIKKDGTNKIRLTEDYANYLNVEDGWIYFSNLSDGGSLYKMQVDGSKKTKLRDTVCENIHLVGDWVYYYVKDRDISRLFQKKLQYFQSQNLSFEEINQKMYEWGKGILMQTNRQKLYRVRKDGTHHEQVVLI